DETPKPTLALTVQRRPEGGYVLYANGEPTDEDHVRALVPELVRRDPGLLATVAADRGIEYGDVVHVVDVVKALGLHRFAPDIEARWAPGGAPAPRSPRAPPWPSTRGWG